MFRVPLSTYTYTNPLFRHIEKIASMNYVDRIEPNREDHDLSPLDVVRLCETFWRCTKLIDLVFTCCVTVYKLYKWFDGVQKFRSTVFSRPTMVYILQKPQNNIRTVTTKCINVKKLPF